MAIEYKRMQQRVGTYAQYETYKDKILPNEFAAVTSGSPDTDDGSALYFKNGTKSPKLIVDESKLKLELKKLKDELNVDGLDSRVTVLENDSTDIEEYIDTAKSAIIDKIDTSESSIKTEVAGSKTAVLNKLGSGAITIDDRIDNAKSNINDNIDTAKNSLSSQMTSNLLSIDIWLTNVQTALSEKVEDVREEFEDKYDELLYEMKKSEKTILQEIKSLADELAVGNSVITGSSTLLMQGGVSQSYAGTITGGDN